MKWYVVVFEGDDAAGWSAYSLNLPGVVAAAPSRTETERLMREAIGGHLAMLADLGEPIAAPADAADVTVTAPA